MKPLNSNNPAMKDDHAGFDTTLRAEHPIVWWFTLLGPIATILGAIVLLAIYQDIDYMQRMVGTFLAAFFLYGRFIILWGKESVSDQVGAEFSPEALFAMVVFMDVVAASLVAFHSSSIFRLPFVGNKLAGLTRDGQIIMRANPWMKNATFFAIIMFVTFPLAATGSIGGSIFGRLLGMSRVMTFFGVVLGSLLGCGVMYFGSTVINENFDRNDPMVKFGGIAIVTGIILLLNFRYRKFKARQLREMDAELVQSNLATVAGDPESGASDDFSAA